MEESEADTILSNEIRKISIIVVTASLWKKTLW